ncbi:undecaprenyl-phosphate alpha-N-acetylglucosaminyltransferase [Clostridium tetanomorphum]|nr:undecaprenyl-phosphate alpha-N-acetylglucosaminyltransferase [Clostridium tetanomorphum]
MNNLILVAIFSTVLSFLLTPLVKKFAIKVRVIDVPKDKRRVHKKPIPLLGGLAIYISFITTLLLKSGPLTNQEKGIILGATLIVIGGFLDDKYEIKPLIKLLFQISAAVILIIFGVRIVNITNPFRIIIFGLK